MGENNELLPEPLPAEPLGVVARWLAPGWFASGALSALGCALPPAVPSCVLPSSPMPLRIRM